MVATSLTIFSDAFSWMKSFVFWLKFHWILFLRAQFTLTQHWFRWWLSAEQTKSHYLHQCWPDAYICGTRGIWVKVKWATPHTSPLHGRRIYHTCYGVCLFMGVTNPVNLLRRPLRWGICKHHWKAIKALYSLNGKTFTKSHVTSKTRYICIELFGRPWNWQASR